MTKTTSIIAMGVGLALMRASTAGAQTESKAFASISVGAQVQEHTFSDSSSFSLFNETATVLSNQSVGRGFVFDVSGGYRVWKNISVAVGLWTFNGSGGASTVASIPDPLLVGHPTTVSTSATSLNQKDVGVNIQAVWMRAITPKIDLAVAGGPSIIHVKQEIGSIAVTPGVQITTAATIDTQSKTTGKAGNVGVDVSYRLTNRYGVGAFIRYAGGEVDLPSSPQLKVGGMQIGIGARVRF